MKRTLKSIKKHDRKHYQPCIYFAKLTESGLTKIGASCYVKNRMKSLSSIYKQPVKLVVKVNVVYVDMYQIESELIQHLVDEGCYKGHELADLLDCESKSIAKEIKDNCGNNYRRGLII